VVRKN